MRRLAALIMSIITAVTVFTVPITGLAAQTDNGLTAYMPRLGSSVGSDMPRLGAGVTSDSAKSVYNSTTYYTKGKQLYNIVRKALAQHKDSVKVNYLSSNRLSGTQLLEAMEQVIFGACSDELSVDSVDGDYALWLLSRYGIDYDYVYKNAKYYYAVDLELKYYTTSQQEKEVDAVINSFKKTIDTSKMTDYQIIKRVHDFICDKATYNNSAMLGSNSLLFDFDYAFSAYGALVKGSCVCQGYAEAFYRICKELGYKCRFVSSDPDEGCHAWNIVQLDGKYYYVDCTWDDEYDGYDFFLVDYDRLRSEDTKNREHTLESRYSTQYFYDKYGSKIAADDYSNDGDNQLSLCTVDLAYKTKTYTGSSLKPRVTVTDSGVRLVQNRDYVVQYFNSSRAGIGIVNINGRGDYAGTYARRTYVINPGRVADFKVKSGSISTTSLSVNWDSMPGATSYIVDRYNGSSWEKVKSTTSTSCTIGSLSPAKVYKFRVRAYYNIYRTGHYSAVYPTLGTATKPKSVTLKSLSAGRGSITAKWSSTACSGYQIQYSRYSDMHNARSVKVGSSYTSKQIKNLTRGKRYYVRVRAYKLRTSGDKKYYYYSSWSSKKSLRTN